MTVEKKSGAIRKHAEAQVVDLPGIYPLSPTPPRRWSPGISC